MAGDSTLLGKTLFRNGCWMQGNGLQEFVADMSLGREPHKIMFDSRTLAECRAYYLNVEEEEEEQVDDDTMTISCRTRNSKTTSSSRSSPRSSRRSTRSPVVDMDIQEEEEEDEEGEKSGNGSSRRGGRSSSRVVQMSKAVEDEMLAVESSKWSLR